jgi:hypothetical protein
LGTDSAPAEFAYPTARIVIQSYTIAHLDGSDASAHFDDPAVEFMPQDGVFFEGVLAFQNFYIRATNATVGNPDEDMVFFRDRRNRNSLEYDFARLFEY